MEKIVRAADMRACDAAAIAGGVSQEELIGRAATALAAGVSALRGESGLPVVFFCGKGNNGGDGRAAAEILRGQGEDAIAIDAFSALPELPKRYIAVDCVFGTGFHGRVPAALAPVFGAMSRGERVLACDIPSGLDADTGIADPLTVPAHATVTFAAYKYGHFFGSGKDFCGKVSLADIGVPVRTDFSALVSGEAVGGIFPKRRNDCHKGSFEKVFLVGGSMEYQGSVAITALAEAALRSGCGYATVVCPKNLKSLSCLENTFRFCGEDALVFDEDTLSEAARADVVVCGMGMGQGKECEKIVSYLIRRAKKLILDADALNLLARHPEWLAEKGGEVYLTPHPGEFARLCEKSVAEVLADPVGLADGYAAAHGVGVLLKGVSSYITDGKTRYVSASGCPALAKAGSGDALSGFCAVPVARAGLFGLAAGSFLHGACAALAQDELTSHGVLASDLPRYLPRVLAGLGV